MYISDLALNQYRSYRELVLELPRGIAVFQGRNGRGKTNLVEAALYLSTLSSHRVSADKALVRVASCATGEEAPAAAVIRAKVRSGTEPSRERLLELEIVQGKANRARLNRAQVRPRDLLGNLRTVMFAPEDVQLLRGDPGGRRRFLDQVITQVKPSYLGVRRDFDQALRQRGAALKQLGPSSDVLQAEDFLAPWDSAMANLSAQMVAHRVVLLESLRPKLQAHYREVSADDKPTELSYEMQLESQERSEFGAKAAAELSFGELPLLDDGYFPDLQRLTENLEERFLAMIRAKRVSELRRSVNLVGAHLDDFSAQIAGLPVKGYASQGETWSAVLALRLAQMDILTSPDDTPVLILDDVFSELDEQRRLALGESIRDVEQVLITAANLSDLPKNLDPSIFTVTLDGDLGSLVDRGRSGALVAPESPEVSEMPNDHEPTDLELRHANEPEGGEDG